MPLAFGLRHFVRHWQLNLAVLAGMVLCSALLGGLPMYAAIVAGQSLSQTLADAYAPVRNLEVHGDDLSPADREAVHASLGSLFKRDIELRDAVLDLERAIYRQSGDKHRVYEVLFLRAWAFPLQDDTRLTAGRLPGSESNMGQDGTTVLEAAIGARAAEYMDLSVGDELALEKAPYRVRIVGIVTPVDPRADLWWSDATLLPFNVERVGTNDVDNLYVSVILHPEAMVEHVPQHALYWRVLLDWAAITADNAGEVRNDLVALGGAMSAGGARVETGLVDLLDRYQSQLSMGRIALLLLTAQSLIAVLYVLATLSAFLVDQSRVELGAMMGRGFSGWQITSIYALEALLLAVLAVPLGPLLAHVGFWLWSRLSGMPGLGSIPGESWWLAAVASAFAWLALVVSLHLVVRRTSLDWQHLRARPARRAGWQRVAIDAFLLALGALVYWQLRDTGSFVREAKEAGSIAADPVLLLGPSLLLLALGLVFVHAFPLVLRGLTLLTRGIRGLVLPLSITRLARDISAPSRVILLVSLTTALVFFASVFGHSIVQRQGEVAHYMAGADLRVALALDAGRAAADAEDISELSDVVDVSPVYRGTARWSVFGTVGVNYRSLEVLAVDPAHHASVSRYPPGIGDRQMGDLLSLLRERCPGKAPAIVSPDAPPGNLRVGSEIEYRVGSQVCVFEVRAITDEFPTLRRPFLVTDLAALEQQAELGDVFQSPSGWRELWLSVRPGAHESLVAALEEQEINIGDAALFRSGRIAGDAGAQLRVFRSDLIARITTAAFALNGAVLLVLSTGSFALTQVFAARRRTREFGVLRAMGLSSAQLPAMLGIEGAIMLLLGLAVGTGVGYGLALAMRPFLSLTLAPSLGGMAIDRMVIGWAVLGRSYAILVGCYGLALFLLLVVLVRSKVHRTLRIGDE